MSNLISRASAAFDAAFLAAALLFFVLLMFRARAAGNAALTKGMLYLALLKALLNVAHNGGRGAIVPALTAFVWLLVFAGARNLAPLRAKVAQIAAKGPQVAAK